jgi:hypothetical protein
MRRTLLARHLHEGATLIGIARRRRAAIAGLALLVACGSRSDPATELEPIPAAALPGSPSEPVVLDPAAMATDAGDAVELEALLRDAGFVAGTERSFSRNGAGRRRMVARVLVFETSAGAARYLQWLEIHVPDLIGGAELDLGLEVPRDGTAFVRQPDPCCHNDTGSILAMWSDGARVITLEIGGQAVRADVAVELASALDAAVA